MQNNDGNEMENAIKSINQSFFTFKIKFKYYPYIYLFITILFYLDDIDNSGIDENAIETKVDYGENESDITKKEKESIY